MSLVTDGMAKGSSDGSSDGSSNDTTGLVLFGHGARDPRWAEPFERLRDKVAASHPGGRVALAYLEMMAPDLDGAAEALVAAGATGLVVVPVFFGQGAHLRRDLPQRIDALRARLPATPVTVADAVGEDEAVLDAIAAYCLRSTA